MHSRRVAVVFVDTRKVDAIVFHRNLLGADDPTSFFTLPG
ncbi:nicotinamide riboside kinase [Arthrobacter sp. UYEF36]